MGPRFFFAAVCAIVASLQAEYARGGSLDSAPAPRGAPPGARAPQVGILVRVLDESGAPLAGAEVEGSSLVNPGPVASTCCAPKTFTRAVTGRDGRTLVGSIPLTFRPITIRATFRDWPSRTWETSQPWTAHRGEVLLMLGPARDVRGTVRLDPSCPARELHVFASPPGQKAAVDPQGAFVLSQVPPWTRLRLEGCGRRQDTDLDTFKGRPVELALPEAREPVAPSPAAPSPVAPSPAAPSIERAR